MCCRAFEASWAPCEWSDGQQTPDGDRGRGRGGRCVHSVSTAAEWAGGATGGETDQVHLQWQTRIPSTCRHGQL